MLPRACAATATQGGVRASAIRACAPARYLAALVVGLGCSPAPTQPAAHVAPAPQPALGAVCAPLRASGTSPLIEDFEADPSRILDHEGRGGWWFGYDDGSGGTFQRDETVTDAGRVLHLVASGFRSWGAGFGASFHPATREHHGCPYDASTYTGVRLRARGQGRLRLGLADATSTRVAHGGTCTRPGNGCHDRPRVWLDLEAEPRTYDFPFCAFWSEGWGGPPQGIDPSRLFSLQLEVEAGARVEAWLDDLAFYRAEAGAPGRRCGPPCPLDAIPRTARIDPTFSAAPLTRELGVHTFQQATRSCGPLTRRYLSYVPSQLGKRSSAPVLIVLHGSGASAEIARTYQARDRFDALAARDGFIVVYGNAAPSSETTPDPGFPNTGVWRQGLFDDGHVDDLEYLTRVLDDLAARGVTDGRGPVYLAGMSNGGGMVLEAARRMPQRITGIAALMPYDGEQPKPPPDLAGTPLRRVLFVYSIGDPGMAKGYHEILAPLPARWAAAMGIPAEITRAPRATALPDRVTEGAGYSGSEVVRLATRDSRVTALDIVSPSGEGHVRVLVLDRAGHFWPNPAQDTDDWVLDRWGFRNQDFDAADAVWEFLRPPSQSAPNR